MLRINDNVLYRMFDGITDPLAIYDQNFRLIMLNQALINLYELPEKAAKGRHCYEVFHNRREICQPCHIQEVFRTGKNQVREKFIPLPDGRQRLFKIQSYPVRDSRGRIIVAIEHGRDLTEARALEGQIQVSNQRYRTLVENVRDGIFTVDASGRLDFANEFLAKMLGYDGKDLVNRSIYDFICQEDVNLLSSNSGGERAKNHELILRKNDGSQLFGQVSLTPMKVNGAVLNSVGIITDVTPLKLAEAKLRAAKEFEEKIVNGITDSLLVIDRRTMRIVQTNSAFLSRVGLKAGAVVGKCCYEIMLGRSAPCDENEAPCPIRKVAKTREFVQVGRMYPDSQGQERMFQISAYPVFDQRGEVDLVIRLEHDITEKRKVEETLAVRSRELQKMQHQMDTLFEVSKQISNKNSLKELLESLQEIIARIFPDADSIFLVLDATGGHLATLNEYSPEIAEPVQSLIQSLEKKGDWDDFLRFLRNNKDSQIVTCQDGSRLPGFLVKALNRYPSWFGLPILTPQQSLGYFILGSQTAQQHFREDMQFLQTLFSQIAGYIRHLVINEHKGAQEDQPRTEKSSFAGLIGKSKQMHEIYELIGLVSGSDATVLITGDNGTGKELVAQAIHRLSHRGRGPFVVANCSAYSPTLLESELFGHERGAFTGAIRQRKGRIERAHGGTLFLDEIGEISPATQVLLLRFLQDHCFERVGGEKTVNVDVRVIAATNRDLRRAVDAGQFRDDLYYRLNVISIHLPTLKEKKEDIPLLAMHFLKRYNLKEGKHITGFGVDAMEALMDYDWPGNVRQLENSISHAVILSQGEIIKKRHLPRFLKESSSVAISSLAESERTLILRVLREANWNKHEAARRLQVSRSTLYSKIQRYDLEKLGGSFSGQ